jgi:transketolase
METWMSSDIEARIAFEYQRLTAQFAQWEVVKDLVDNLLDVTLNYRQSGHPGGSRSKVHALVATFLGGTMRWDIRHPEKRFGDRFVLVGGHTVPLIYCTLAVFNEALRIKYAQTGNLCYRIPPTSPRHLSSRDHTGAIPLREGDGGEVSPLYWEDLLQFRRRGGLSGHAEMEGKTLFLKFNTGPSGHGAPAAAGLALALKRAGASGVKVFAFDGETGLTPGGVYETMNSAWGLALDNLNFVVDWNDFGIDEHPVSQSVYGTPVEWFSSHGWRVFGTEHGSEWGPVARALLEMALSPNPDRAPSVTWVKTRKGRGYLKYDNASHGVPHKMNSDLFWETKRDFVEKYDVAFTNYGGPPPSKPAAVHAEFEANLRAVIEVLHRNPSLVEYLADRLVALGDSVPSDIPTFRLAPIVNRRPAPVVGQVSSTANRQSSIVNPFSDPRLYDFRNYPADLYVAPGTSIANRMALGKWGAWANAFGAQEYGRPLFLACSADLAESTNISGFGKAYGEFPGYGWYERYGGPDGVMLPQEITEFANAGILAGVATVNFALDPGTEFDGFWGACSTYGAFSYLKYGMLRLLSQIAQDCQWKVGKLLYVAGHSGPETADDSRTHFGVFEPGVMQLFPAGRVLNLYPWEYNEVPVLLGAALREDVPIVALHLTRPPITIPDREALGMPSHFAAARGAYVAREYRPDQPRGGAAIVQGTSAMDNVVKILPELDDRGLNVKIVYAASAELYALQPEAYRESVLSPGDRADSTVITTQSLASMREWILNTEARVYAMSADWDNRWRTGGTVDEVLDEAHLSPHWLLSGIERFVREREERLGRLRSDLAAALQGA